MNGYEVNKARVYTTTFCNFAHRLDNGRPVNHECYVLRPKLLKMELYDGAQAVLEYMRDNNIPSMRR